MNTGGIKIQGDATINGVNTMTVGKLIAGLDVDDANEQERHIAVQVGRKVAKMKRKGYAPKDAAAYAHDLAARMALALG